MFLKSFSSNIGANYEVGKQPIATSGAWKVFNGKKKSTAAQASIFVFERKSLEVGSGGFGARSSATSIKKAQDEVVERLKKEANSLARLRHPSILQLVEPVEDTRNGGLMFATEPVTASLGGLLADKDDQERSSGIGGRPSRYVVEDPDGTRRRRNVIMDELEIQKGLLQVAKGLEFLHESANLVHGNLTPGAIYVNAKSDWKISGLSFSGPPNGVEGHQALPPISLSEVLYQDPRIPRSVQLNLDYASPDFVLDNNVTSSADIYSLGLVTVALYNFPHTSPLETGNNQSTYKKLFGSSLTTPSSSNNMLSSRPLPQELAQTLPRLLARRPAQRLTAREFQQSAYFDNILVNTIRFLDDLPAKTANEKAQFMRGLGRVMPQFPPSVLAKKVLGALLDEMKDKELLALILQNVFNIIKAIPSGPRVFPDKVLPRFREVFLPRSTGNERDASKEAGLMVVLENISVVSKNCSGKQFKDDVLPLIELGMESPTHSLVDKSLQTLPVVLPILDFSTIKHDLFPVVASVFSKTSSLSIKVRGLEALNILCGGSLSKQITSQDDLSGLSSEEKASKATSSTALDRFTVQEKVVPLLKGIKTKEPAVMMAALGIFQQVSRMADTDFLATEVLPILWSFSLGPLLNLEQFQAFMTLVRSISSKIEREHARKLQELSATNRSSVAGASETSTGNANGIIGGFDGSGTEEDFERLVLGNKRKDDASLKNSMLPGYSATLETSQQLPSFSWSSTDASGLQSSGPLMGAILQPQRSISRSITPDTTISAFPSLQPVGNTTLGTSQASTSAWGPSTPFPAQAGTQHASWNPTLATRASIRSPSQGYAQPSSQLSSFSVPQTLPLSTWQNQAPAVLNGALMPAISPPPSNIQVRPTAPTQYGGGLGGSVGRQSTPVNQGRNTTGLDKYQSLL